LKPIVNGIHPRSTIGNQFTCRMLCAKLQAEDVLHYRGAVPKWYLNSVDQDKFGWSCVDRRSDVSDYCRYCNATPWFWIFSG